MQQRDVGGSYASAMFVCGRVLAQMRVCMHLLRAWAVKILPECLFFFS